MEGFSPLINSRPNILAFVRHVLRGSEAFAKIRKSSFEKLFDLPTRQFPVSCKLIHSLLSPQLRCNQEHTLWSVFGKDHLRFSLEEFGTITGLNCGSFPDGYEAPDNNRKDANKQKGAHKDPLIWLALIIILDGVLIASQQIHRPTLRYVQMLDDVDAFLEFPWGRESFLHTVRCMKPPKFEKGKTVDSPVDMLVLKLKQETFRLTDAVLQVEVNPSLRVTPLIPVIGTVILVGVSPNDKTDDKPKPPLKAMWPEEIAEPVFTFTPIPENPVHKKHTVPRKRKESMLKPHKAGKETSVPTDQHEAHARRPPHQPRLQRTNATVMVARITGLEATVAKLGASNERLKQKLHRKRKRSRATSLLPQFVVTHRRRSAPQAPQTNDLPGDDHHDSPNSNRRKTKQVSDGILGSGSPILSQYCAQYCASRRIDFNNPFFTDHLLVDHPSADHTSSPHQYPGPHSPLSHSHNQRSTPLLATDHNSSDHISPNHQTHNHPSPTSGYANHNSPNHDPQSCEALVVDPLDHAPPIHIHPTTTTSDTPAPDHNSPLPTFSLAQHSPTMNTSTELSPLFTAVTSPKHPLPPAHALSHQGSLSQQYAPIGTLPEFDATPLNKPSSQSSPSHGHTLPEPDTAPPVYDSSALLYSPIPLFNPTPAATTPPTISPNPLFTPPPGLTTTPTSSPNKLTGFSTHYSTPNAFAATASLKGSTSRLIYQDPTNKHGVGEASDSSPDKTAQTSVLEVCELIDSSPARKTKEHHPFHVTPSKLDFSNQFLLQLATPSQWTDSLHMAVLMHMLDMHHKDVLQMENATFMPPTLTSLMQCKDHQFQATVKKDKIRWDHRISKLILLSGKIWMKEVQKVYTPMIRPTDRGLASHRLKGHVDALDSLPSLYDEEDVQRFLRPNLQMLPYLIRYLVKNNSQLHLFGDPYPHMSGLTDAMVDKFRQQYAMEAYKTIVLPAYY
ncbi:hypothetical protein Bca52824_071737 [Brassica carinata]|uniref:DUF1985 domain-containing protein n=1 Tax=Brassica carinata TaxID=52824 RepID=A0A8X7Q7Y9_BRACI|nr:hypothetical protein Bca52824_071737 [Brassica carinata]